MPCKQIYPVIIFIFYLLNGHKIMMEEFFIFGEFLWEKKIKSEKVRILNLIIKKNSKIPYKKIQRVVLMIGTKTENVVNIYIVIIALYMI